MGQRTWREPPILVEIDPQETFAEPRGPVTAITKCLIWVPSVTRVTVAARELRQFGRTSERMVRPQGDAYGVETMSRFRRHARAEYGHGAGQSRAAILRNAPHQTQCELNDAELEVVVGGEMDVQGAADQISKQQSENRLEQQQKALELFQR